MQELGQINRAEHRSRSRSEPPPVAASLLPARPPRAPFLTCLGVNLRRMARVCFFRSCFGICKEEAAGEERW